MLKNCLVANDGTHISAWVLVMKQISYRGIKTIIIQNTMCICDFNMMFTYVYLGWKGSAHDSEVFLDVLTNPNVNFPWPNGGKCYINLIFLHYLYLNFL